MGSIDRREIEERLFKGYGFRDPPLWLDGMSTHYMLNAESFLYINLLELFLEKAILNWAGQLL